MYPYEGELIHMVHDELGRIEVIQSEFERALHFGSAPKQSAMLLADPIRLSLSYTRAMTVGLLFRPQPQRILLVGLGGGSLAKFVMHHFPDCHLDVVEYRAKVAEVAFNYFGLRESPHLTLHLNDAGTFLRGADAQRYGEYDLILIDAFDEQGMSRSVCGVSVYDACRARLSTEGALTINLWSGDWISLEDNLEALGTSFDRQVLRLPVEGKENVIALATNVAGPRKRLKRLNELARELDQRLDVEYPALLKALRKYNRGWLF